MAGSVYVQYVLYTNYTDDAIDIFHVNYGRMLTRFVNGKIKSIYTDVNGRDTLVT